MTQSDIQLRHFLLSKKLPVVLYTASDVFAHELSRDIPNVVRVTELNASALTAGISAAKSLTTSSDRSSRNGSFTAVFDQFVADIPARSVIDTMRAGAEVTLVRSISGWMILPERQMQTKALIARLRVKQIMREPHVRWSLFLRKFMLRFFAKNVFEAASGEVCPNGGQCFIAVLPQYQRFSDGEKAGKVLLFEEHKLLLAQQPHDAIRLQGAGRYSFWERTLYLSSSDNTDPRVNRRRYRIVILRRFSPLRYFFPPIAGDLDRVHGKHSPAELGKVLEAISAAYGATTLHSNYQADSSVALLSALISRISHSELRRGLNVRPNSVFAVASDLVNSGQANVREFVSLLQGLRSKGLSVALHTDLDSDTNASALMKNCERSKIQVENLSSSPVRTSHLQHSELRVDSLRVIASLPDTLRAEVFTLFSHIQAGVPGLVHCWGDESNVCGGLAAVLSGVPSIVFSARGVSPDRYPPTGRDTHFDLYQTLMKSSAAHWLATSRDGASSYVQWLSLDPARVSLVRLGIPQSDQDPFTALSAFRESPWQERSSERERTLAALEIPASAVVVGGVFELVDSARPLRFVRLIFELHRQNPNLFGIIAGAGALESHVREEIEQLKLSKVCFVLPADEDCNLARSSFDLFVHCGSVSDLSSTFMEAASQGIPVFVPTGDPLASPLQQDRSGIFSIDSGGVTAEFSKLTATILHLTQNAELRRSVGETGKALARDSFSSKTSTEQVLSLYRALGFDVELALQRELQAEDSVTDARLAKASIS